jgi:hypothetical protein
LVLGGKRQIQTRVLLTERHVIQSLCITYLTANQKYWMDSWPIVQGYSKRSIHFQEFILQVLLNIRWCAMYRIKGELSKLFSHLTSTRCEPHVWHGRCQIDNPALPTLVPVVDRLPGWQILSITCPKMSLHTWHWRLGEFQHAESFLLCACRHFEHNTPWHIELLCTHLATSGRFRSELWEISFPSVHSTWI